MPEKPHVCLVVDNPLRDLEGLVLLARELSRRGATATLVPMYEQGFDVPALYPDLVLLNYTRPNNADLLKSYKRAGILVGVLDTEGIAGKDVDQFAQMVKSVGCADMVDLYCVWGQAQYAAFVRHGTVSADLLHATGCPRFDFCAAPWRAALPQPSVAPGFVLINTNFPTVNPRFSSSSSNEEQSMVQAGFTREFARQFIADAANAHRLVLNVSIKLARSFPDVQFVLRPHPFENIGFYDAFADLPNAHVKQDGTSLEWIAGARLLIHQNCSTAIEAAMLKVEPLSMEWFNTPALRLNAASGVSQPVASEADLIELVKRSLDGKLPSAGRETEEFRRQIFGDLFTAIDGSSCARVADAVLRTISAAKVSASRRSLVLPRSSMRGLVAAKVRRTFGYKASSVLRRSYASSESERRRLGKAFTTDAVNAVLRRVAAAAKDNGNFVAQPVNGRSHRAARMLSGASLQLVEAI